jgi:hypothetical protein
MGNKMTMQSDRAIKKINIIKEAISNKSLTRSELEVVTGIDCKSLRGYVKYLKENNEVYIACFQRKGKTYAPCYQVGDKQDATYSTMESNPIPPLSVIRCNDWVPRCDWAASWIPIRGRNEEIHT